MFPPFLFIFCCKTVLFDCQKYKTCLVSTYNCLSQWGAFVLLSLKNHNYNDLAFWHHKISKYRHCYQMWFTFISILLDILQCWSISLKTSLNKFHKLGIRVSSWNKEPNVFMQIHGRFWKCLDIKGWKV